MAVTVQRKAGSAWNAAFLNSWDNPVVNLFKAQRAVNGILNSIKGLDW